MGGVSSSPQSPAHDSDKRYKANNIHIDGRLPSSQELDAYKKAIVKFTRVAFNWKGTQEDIQQFMADESGRAYFVSYMKKQMESSPKVEASENLFRSLAAIKEIEPDSNERLFQKMRPLIEMKAFENFLVSEEFEAWVRNQHASVDDKIDLRQMESSSIILGGTDGYDGYDIDNSVTPKGLARAALRNLRIQDRSLFVINKHSWITAMLATAEFLPLPFSIALVDPERKFPLIYVNPAFESLTGYDRKEVVGKNCNFLQVDSSTGKALYSNESKEIKELNLHIHQGVPTVARLVNFRKNGQQFENNLVLQPLFDQSMTYRFLIGLQYDITSAGGTDSETAAMVMKNEKLMKLLPNFFFDHGVETDDELFGRLINSSSAYEK